jgi:pimeloyl-ACP methyl ester carboxylesterase
MTHRAVSVVFGGWGTGVDILMPLFGPSAIYVDVNPIMPTLIEQGELQGDWLHRLLAAVRPQIPVGEPLVLAGWSTGAICALALTGLLAPVRLVLLSPTPSFCRRTGWRHGQRPEAVRSMRNALAADPTSVLDEFYRNCGITGRALPSIPVGQLESGLCFLEQIALLPLQRIAGSSIILHGSSDAIVPPAAGRFVAQEIGGRFEEIAGPHAFFDSEQGTDTVLRAMSD